MLLRVPTSYGEGEGWDNIYSTQTVPAGQIEVQEPDGQWTLLIHHLYPDIYDRDGAQYPREAYAPYSEGGELLPGWEDGTHGNGLQPLIAPDDGVAPERALPSPADTPDGPADYGF